MLVYSLASVIILLAGSVLSKINKNVLIDLKNFKYAIDSSVCDVFKRNEFLGVIIVTSAVGHVQLRSSHRESISQSELNQMGLARVFLLGELPEPEKELSQVNLTLENDQYKDLVQGKFLDTYRNITYKNVMGLKWVSEKYPNAKFIIKLDDDTLYDVFFYRNYLKELDMDLKFKRGDYIAGKLSPSFKVHRNNSKWSVPVEEFAGDTFPKFVGGAFSILTTQVARKLVETSEITPFFWVEDIYISGILREKANITLTSIGFWAVDAKKCTGDKALSNYCIKSHARYDNRNITLLVTYTEEMRQKNLQQEGILVELKDFKYVMDSPVCDPFIRNELLGVIIITSAVGHVELRSSHRESISQSELNQMGLARVFLLGEIPKPEKKITQLNLTLENDQYQDLVQGNFIDKYRNITYKNMMGLKWASEKCSNAKFIIKMDDDTVYDVFFYRNYLNKLDTDLNFDRENFLAGKYSPTFDVHRNSSKWSVPKEDFPADRYPKFVGGAFSILTTQVARKLVKTSETTPFFWIEDIYISGILREKANINLTSIGHWATNAKKLTCNQDNQTAWSNYCEHFHAGYDNRDSTLLVAYTDAMRQKNLQQESFLVDLEDFKYVMESSVCDAFERNELLGVIIVTSYVANIELRSSHRQSISQSELNQMGLTRVFVVGQIPEREQNIKQVDFQLEFEENKDLVQGNFEDVPRNATYKNVMGLKWASKKCGNAKFIIKMDDDTVYDVFFYRNYINERNMDVEFDRNHFFAGTVSSKLVVHRSNSKWNVTVEEFPGDTYPPFVGGGFYITTTQVAQNLVKLSNSTSFFWIDEIYVTGILTEKANITLTNIGQWSVQAKSLECSDDNEEITAWLKFSCDYHVGFDNRDSNLLAEYTEAMRQKSLHDIE